jgi:exosortase H (IPTLxxWG-CTERM-specific)
LNSSRPPSQASATPARIGPGSIRPGRFAAIFGICFLSAFGVLMTPPAQKIDQQFSRALVKVAGGLIHLCGGKTLIQGAVLRDPVAGFAVEMRDGCNAVNVTFLLWSAVLAFPAPPKQKALGLLAGSLIIQVVNIVRFISLYYIGQYSLTWFDFAHGYLWETLLVLDTMVVFWLWVNRVFRVGAVANAGR